MLRLSQNLTGAGVPEGCVSRTWDVEQLHIKHHGAVGRDRGPAAHTHTRAHKLTIVLSRPIILQRHGYCAILCRQTACTIAHACWRKALDLAGGRQSSHVRPQAHKASSSSPLQQGPMASTCAAYHVVHQVAAAMPTCDLHPAIAEPGSG